MEKRINQGGLYQMHILQREDGSESRTIEGYAVVWEKESVQLWDWRQKHEQFFEIIERGAIDEETLKKCDVRAVLYHDQRSLLARWNGGNTGGLELELDENGLKFRFEAPRCPDGDTALALVRNGSLDGCSFAFTDGDFSWSKRTNEQGETEYIRTVKTIAQIFDVTLTPDPAYPSTSVSAREVAAQLEEVDVDVDVEVEDEDIAADEAAEQAARERRCRMFGTVNYDLTNF